MLYDNLPPIFLKITCRKPANWGVNQEVKHRLWLYLQ